jgi:hypothetical protein
MRICFVCQSGPSEPKAVLLAASLRVHFPPDTELIAAHPSLMGSLRTETEHVLSALGVVTLPIRNPLGDDFLIAHKLAALMLLGGPGLGIFLDTDTLAMAPPEPLLDVLSAVPATDNQFPLPVWQHAYRSSGPSLPASAPPTLRSGERTAPYFNSGMIAVPGPLAGRLAACWIETAQRLEVDPRYQNIGFVINFRCLSRLCVSALRFAPSIRDGTFPGGLGASRDDHCRSSSITRA